MSRTKTNRAKAHVFTSICLILSTGFLQLEAAELRTKFKAPKADAAEQLLVFAFSTRPIDGVPAKRDADPAPTPTLMAPIAKAVRLSPSPNPNLERLLLTSETALKLQGLLRDPGLALVDKA